MSSIKMELEQNELKRMAFHAALARLREHNALLNEIQRKYVVDKTLEKKKPVGERNSSVMSGKSWVTALEITITLRAMRKLKGLPMTTIQRKICRCCGHIISEREVEVHALPKTPGQQLTLQQLEAAIKTLTGI